MKYNIKYNEYKMFLSCSSSDITSCVTTWKGTHSHQDQNRIEFVLGQQYAAWFNPAQYKFEGAFIVSSPLNGPCFEFSENPGEREWILQCGCMGSPSAPAERQFVLQYRRGTIWGQFQGFRFKLRSWDKDGFLNADDFVVEFQEDSATFK